MTDNRDFVIASVLQPHRHYLFIDSKVTSVCCFRRVHLRETRYIGLAAEWTQHQPYDQRPFLVNHLLPQLHSKHHSQNGDQEVLDEEQQP